MYSRRLTIGGLVVAASLVSAQTTTRRAAIVGGGDANQGKCTVEVVVDASAQVEIRGDNATLRNTGGQAPQWRRFECTGAMPANPTNFRFAGVDGRGRQTLLRDPRNNGGAAVVEIQDSQGGAEAYTFDLFWGGGPAVSGGFRQDGNTTPGDNRRFEPGNQPPVDQRGGGRFEQGESPRFDQGDDRRYDRDRDRYSRRMTDQQALDVCRRSIQDQASERFRTPGIEIRNLTLENNPGRRDWISGDLAIRRRFGRQEIYRFTCSVDFETGQVRSARIDQFERSLYPDRR